MDIKNIVLEDLAKRHEIAKLLWTDNVFRNLSIVSVVSLPILIFLAALSSNISGLIFLVPLVVPILIAILIYLYDIFLSFIYFKLEQFEVSVSFSEYLAKQVIPQGGENSSSNQKAITAKLEELVAFIANAITHRIQSTKIGNSYIVKTAVGAISSIANVFQRYMILVMDTLAPTRDYDSFLHKLSLIHI